MPAHQQGGQQGAFRSKINPAPGGTLDYMGTAGQALKQTGVSDQLTQ